MHFIPLLPEVDAISGPEIQLRFGNSLADWLNISEISIFHPVYVNAHPSAILHIERSEPLLDRNAAVVGMTDQNLSWLRFQGVYRLYFSVT